MSIFDFNSAATYRSDARKAIVFWMVRVEVITGLAKLGQSSTLKEWVSLWQKLL